MNALVENQFELVNETAAIPAKGRVRERALHINKRTVAASRPHSLLGWNRFYDDEVHPCDV